jgi:predicted nucleic acid-binding protein
MIILDTSVWIEYLRNNQAFFPRISKLLENREVLAVECVFGELLQGVKTETEREIIIDYWTYLPKEYYINIIIQAGEYSARNKLINQGVGLLDAIILMHGIISNSKIWTLDNKFLKVIPEELRYLENTKNGISLNPLT